METSLSDILEIFEKYKDAEGIHPAWQRLELFSWNDMLALKAEIESLQSQLFDCRQEIFNISLDRQNVQINPRFHGASDE
jgi:hypothetical protein